MISEELRRRADELDRQATELMDIGHTLRNAAIYLEGLEALLDSPEPPVKVKADLSPEAC